MLELKISTLQGNRDWCCQSDDLTIADLKRELYNASGTDSLPGLALPEPDRQNLVYNGRSLEAGNLKDHGLKTGESIVILRLPDSPSLDVESEPDVPDEGRIQEEIRSYAVKHGLESQLNSEEDCMSTHSGGVLISTDRGDIGVDQLQEIIDALEATMSSTTTPVDESGMNDDFEIPEPDGNDVYHISQMMNIPLETARKAMLLNRNNPSEALAWILEHQEEADFHSPVSEDSLRTLYRSNPRPSTEEGNGGLIAQIADMESSHEQASDAFQRTQDILEVAMGYLMRTHVPDQPSTSGSIGGGVLQRNHSIREMPEVTRSGLLNEGNSEPFTGVSDEMPPSEVTEEHESIVGNQLDDELIDLEAMDQNLTELDESAVSSRTVESRW
eukprot:g9238.t1